MDINGTGPGEASPGARTLAASAVVEPTAPIKITPPPLLINETYSQLSSSLQDQLSFNDKASDLQHHSSTSTTGHEPSSISYSNTSASEETEEESVEDGEDDSKTDSDEEELNTRLEKPTYGKPRSGWNANDEPDLLLHSLESERYGPTVQKYISKYLDDGGINFPFGQKSKLDSKEKEKDADDRSSDASGRVTVTKNGPIVMSSHGRTIKAATRHIDAQGRKALSRLQSHSMNDLTNLSAPPSPCTAHIPPGHAANSSTSGDGYSGGNSLDPNGMYKYDKPSVPSVAVRAVIESQMDLLQKNTQESANASQKLDFRRKKRVHHKEKGLRFADGKIAELNENESPGDVLENERKISQTSQFNCLPSRPIYQSSSRLTSSTSMRSLSLQAPDCPSERIQFYKSFVQLLRAGKIKRGSDGYLGNNTVPAGGFVELVFKQELRDLIWLETKAWLSNRTMIEMDSYLCEKRKQIPETIHKILRFDLSVHQKSSRSESLDAVMTSNQAASKAIEPLVRARTSTMESKYSNSTQSSQTSALADSSSQPVSGSASDSHENSHETPDLRTIIDQDTLAASVAAKLTINEMEGGSVSTVDSEDRKKSVTTSTPTIADDENCTCSETLSRLCQNCVDKETEAINKVSELLVDLEEVEHLYPCTRALAHDYPVYVSEQVTARLRSLYLFINVTRDLREKTNLMAKMFMIQNRAAAGWPVYDGEYKDFSSDSCEATPEIRTAQDYSGYSYKMSAPVVTFGVAKQVHFRTPMSRSEAHGSNSDHTISAPESPEVQTPQAVEVFETSTSSLASSSGYNSANGINYQSKENPFFKQRPSIYRKYVDKALKHKGLKQIYAQLNGILRPLLYRVHASLKKPTSYADGVATSTSSSNQTLNVNTDNNFEKRSILPALLSREYCEELSQYGVWSLAYQQMALPTFHRPFLFLLRVTVDVVHECLRTRLEQQPENPSAVSIGQLIKECKEVVKAGVQIRQRYVNLAQTVLGEGGSEVIEAQLDTFDDDLKTMLHIYLKYLDMRMQFIQKLAPVSADAGLVPTGIGSSLSLRLKAHLEEEWNFVRLFCPHIPGGEALAANKFCCMSSNFLSAICESIETGIDQCLVSFNESLATARIDPTGFRKGILSCCRRFKAVFQEASARACQATAFAKTLRKDLEIAAEFKCLVDAQTLCKKLRETGHIRIVAPNSMNHLIFVPNYLQANETLIWQLVDMVCGGRNLDIPTSDHDSGGYLIVFLSRENDVQWSGPVVVLEPTAEATISLSHIEVDGVLFVVNYPSQLISQSRAFQHLMVGALQIDKMQTACNHAIAEALNDLKAEALEIQNKISHSLNLIYDQLDMSRVPPNDLNEQDRLSLQARCLEITHLGFKFGFEYEKSLTRLITGERKAQLGRQLISFAQQWMKFVVTKCERGRGLRTRWTNQGLLYLMVALEPQYLQILNDTEFESLKKQLDACMTHLIGSNDRSTKHLFNAAFLVANKPAYSVLAPAATNKPLASSLNFHRSQSVSTAFSERSTFPMMMAAAQQAQDNSECFNASKGTRLEEWDKAKGKWKFHSTTNIEGITEGDGQRELSPLERIRAACDKVEIKRHERLRDKGVVGHVSDVVIQRAPLHITARKVPFQWQRGFKIGEGRFGKVYTAVNNQTGELIAMKEIKLQPNDHRAVKEAIDEIRTFEGIKHPHIVRYFGVEIHREEMYIFMEYCNEGSLESAAQLHIPEHLVRKYTRQLLDAVNCLHENGIVHRDIKSANIFLTSDGNLKLGDFGCCAKLKNHTTMPGEINAFVGTPAYMAPEVFTRNTVEGHGRAADIWSVGCVVLEMLTAKRPWPDLDNSYQIMFRVGMGETPEIPDDLPEEGQDFVNRCLQHDPRLRWSAGQLLGHTFTKVSEEDDDL